MKDLDLFYPNRVALISAGMLPTDALPKHQFPYRIFRCYCNLCYLLSAIMEIGVYFTYPLQDIITGLNINIATLICDIKVLLWTLRTEELRSIMDELQHPNEIFDQFDSRKIFRQSYKKGLYFTAVFYGACALSHVTNFGIAVLRGVIGWTTEVKLPFPIWIPFAYQHSQCSYLVAATYVNFIWLPLTTAAVSNDILYMNVINYTTAHLTVLKGAFRSIRMRSERQVNANRSLEDVMFDEWKKCIRYLQWIYNIINKVENVYQFMVLIQALSTLIALTSTLLKMASVPVTDSSFGLQVVHLIFAAVQLNFYCWFGHDIFLKANELSYSLYENEWLGNDKRCMQCMLITMCRLQRPSCFTVAKIAPLNLTTSVFVVKTAYSFFTTLKTALR